MDCSGLSFPIIPVVSANHSATFCVIFETCKFARDNSVRESLIMTDYKFVKGLIFTLLLSLVAFNAMAQQTARIRGKLVDSKTGDSVPQANVLLLKAGTDEQVTGAASDLDGFFVLFNMPVGTYDVKIKVLGYEEKLIEGIEVSAGKPMNRIGRVELTPTTLQLEDVSFAVTREEIELAPDKKVYRIGKDIISASSNVSEVLDNIPSVTVDLDGTVELRGDSNVRILIDGKPSSQMATNAAEALQQLPADLVEKVEVVTNPSAKYDAQGTAGIINIVLKKQRAPGVNGSVNVNTGYPHRHGASTNLNYRLGKVNLFLNEGFRYRSMTREGIIEQEFYDNPDFTYLDQKSEWDRGGWGNRLKAGMEYFFDQQTSMTFSGFHSYRQNDNENVIDYEFSTVPNMPTSRIRRTDPEDEIDRWYGGEIDFYKGFNGDGNELTATFKYETGEDIENSLLFEEELFNSSGVLADDLTQDVYNKESETEMLFQVDYSHIEDKEHKFEFGVKSEMQTRDNDYWVNELDGSGSWVRLDNVSDVIKYDENIHAAYVTYANRFGPLAIQAGVRGEYSDITTSAESASEDYDRDYMDWFPSLHSDYHVTETNSIQLSYSRRIHRPHHWLLIPFYNYSDSRNIRSGNPDLNPEYTDALELGHLYYWDKGSINSSVYYHYTDDVIQRIQTSQDSVIVTKPYNFSERQRYGFEWVATYMPQRGMNFSANFNYFRALTKGTWEGQELDSDDFSWFARFSARYQIARSYQFQARFNYRGPHEGLQGKRKAMYALDLGVSHNFWNGNATLAFNVRDVLNTRKRQYETFADSFYSYSEFQWHPRMMQLTFSYRFNQDKKDRKGRPGANGMDMDNGDMDLMD